MGLLPQPDWDSGWRPQTPGWRCRICGAHVYAREIRQHAPPSNWEDWRLLFRHGEEGGAVLEVQWDDESGFIFPGNSEVDQCARDEDWWIAWQKQIHAHDPGLAEAAD